MSTDALGVVVAIVIGAIAMASGLLALAYRAGSLVSEVTALRGWQKAIVRRLDTIDKKLLQLHQANDITEGD